MLAETSNRHINSFPPASSVFYSVNAHMYSLFTCWISIWCLCEYWDYSWPTYLRGRNGRIVSHIQILRNMCKGEPEYHLVAGGEELFGGPVKLESPDTPHNLLSIEDHDDDLSFPDNSPPELLHAEPLETLGRPSPRTGLAPNLSFCYSENSMDAPRQWVKTAVFCCALAPSCQWICSAISSANWKRWHGPHDFPPSPAPGLSYSPSSPLLSLSDIYSPPHTFPNLTGPYSYAPNQKALPAVGYTAFAHQQHASNPVPLRYPNRTASITLLAEGMTAFTINFDKLSAPVSLPSRTPPLNLHIRLSIPAVDHSRAQPNL
ncbi:hypothetical protein R3P38DRAFT_3230070 [Favolaschia claudopus]|uniref:Uncharacterized protein n=1 Tax=Favolaschia claudopus TaxID=2862362 RepID=A0AAV9ZNF1_9AGAR